ncbi:hypothetical protein TNIN_208881 [Trichonephila inaurata madagascariensis]|uniref:Uncharacterized protein n=1 Tax=Trichonephila inaurata madagascariensis TaxID=2747483 RepID=A0A8X6IKM6_9ARAC|nr:hypothetical protein TNIN_208881 [Trichonephila inaurata madagascariensis]
MKAERPVVDTRKEVQEKKEVITGFQKKAFFCNPVIASSITGINEIQIKNLVLITITYGHKINAQKLKEFCLATVKLCAALYPWYYTCLRASTKD